MAGKTLLSQNKQILSEDRVIEKIQSDNRVLADEVRDGAILLCTNDIAKELMALPDELILKAKHFHATLKVTV